MNARLVAWHMLQDTRCVDRAAFRRAARASELAPLDRATLAAILSVEARRRAALRAIAENLGERRLRPDVVAFAHLGIAQLLFLDTVPDHAAIGETVEAARTALGERPASAVNGLLRRIQRKIRQGTSGDPRRDVPLAGVHFDEPVFADPVAHWLLWAEQALSLPVPIGRRWRNRFGDAEALRLATAALGVPDVSLFVPRADPDAIRAELALPPADGERRTAAHPRVLLAPASARARLRTCAARARGDVAFVGETSVRSAELLAARAGERVLELCAHRATPHPGLAASGAEVVVHAPDAAREPAFDAAFVLAPSSATGALASKPGLRWRFDAPGLARLAQQQEAWLARAAASVRAGGRLVYATRSLEPDENQRRVRAFVAARTDWSLRDELAASPGDRETRSTIGSETSGDGGYAALLVRS